MKRSPELFGGADDDFVRGLFSDEIADAIAAHPAPRPSYARPVRNLTTGEVYRSLNHAVRWHETTVYKLKQAIANGTLADGCKWRFE